MSLLRSLLLENIGLKLVALLLALMVYLNVFTERPATMVVDFPIEFTDMPDSLALSGPALGAVQAELRGTGKQFIRLWLTEPRFKISLAGLGPGSHRRTIRVEDLPLITSDRITVQRLVSPESIDLEVERKTARLVPLAPRVVGTPPPGMAWSGTVLVDPPATRVRGPARAVAMLDSVRLEPVAIHGGRDSIRVEAKAIVPDHCSIDPATATVIVPLTHQR